MLRPCLLAALLLAAVAVQGAEQNVEWTLGVNYTPLTLSSGDTAQFNWAGLHGIWKLPTNMCPTGANMEHTPVVEPQDGGTWTFTCGPDTKGDNFYACPVDGHCSAGMLLQITCNA